MAGLVLGAWAGLLVFLLAFYQPNWRTPWPYLLALLQTHLYTGLFITAHDAMHGVVSPNKRLNNAVGTLTALLFAYNWFPRMLPKHHAHHRHVATEDDPDFHDGKHVSFVAWFVRFAWNYVTVWQIVLMAATYNLLKYWFPQANVIGFWMVPAVLATMQLFFFGTYLPIGVNMPSITRTNRARSFGTTCGLLRVVIFSATTTSITISLTYRGGGSGGLRKPQANNLHCKA